MIASTSPAAVGVAATGRFAGVVADLGADVWAVADNTKPARRLQNRIVIAFLELLRITARSLNEEWGQAAITFRNFPGRNVLRLVGFPGG
jgi:hypothetical protein